MRLIATTEDLAQFRSAELGGSALITAILGVLGAVLIRLPVGVGKSTAIDNLLSHLFLHSGLFDLVIVCAPTHRILNERAILKVPSHQSIAQQLRGRSAELCGPKKDREWQKHERAATAALGKQLICGSCEHRDSCFWPEQMRRISSQTKVILLTQSYLKVNPGILGSLVRRTGASKPLVMLDEIDFSRELFRQRLRDPDLERYSQVLETYLQGSASTPQLERYLQHLRLMRQAPTENLRDPSWRFPLPAVDVVLALQRLGVEQYGEDFYFPGYDLAAFSCQDPGYRTRTTDGHVEFLCLPDLEANGKLVVLSGTASKRLLEHRLSMSFTELFADCRFKHQDSRFYNLNLGSGIGRYHREHLPRMADFAVQYLIRQMRRNRSMAVLTKKKFLGETVESLNLVLNAAWLRRVRAVPLDEWDRQSRDILQIPVLHYGGAIGFNDLEDIDSIVCLAGYYIRTEELNRLVNEVSRDHAHRLYKIATATRPLRRVVMPANPHQDPSLLVTHLAQEVLQQEEMGTVIQAIGRVRPFTRPREVLLCQCGASPLMPYDREFSSLEEARQHFGLQSAKAREPLKTWAPVQYLKRYGHTQKQIAERLGVSLRTVANHWTTGPWFQSNDEFSATLISEAVDSEGAVGS